MLLDDGVDKGKGVKEKGIYMLLDDGVDKGKGCQREGYIDVAG